MSEKQVKKLFQGITGIDDDIIEEAQTSPPVKKTPIRRRWGAVAACLCLALLAGVLAWRSAPGENAPEGGSPLGKITPTLRADGTPPGENTPGTGGSTLGEITPTPRVDGIPPGENAPECGSTLGKITPTLRVGDTLYRWTGMSVLLSLDPSGSVTFIANGSTYLPECYQPCGDISGVTRETPTEDLQLQAEFEASGTVFTSEDCPAAVYVLMTTSWFENSYVRFASDALGENELLSWQGRMYRFSLNGDISRLLTELPEGCELIGNLHFVGRDCIPIGDLETNNMSDGYSKPIEGREVYAIPGDDSALYVYEHQYWREGDYPAWRECRLWETLS